MKIVNVSPIIPAPVLNYEFRYSSCPHHEDFAWVNKNQGTCNYRILVLHSFTPQSWKVLKGVQQVKLSRRSMRGFIQYIGTITDKDEFEQSLISIWGN